MIRKLHYSDTTSSPPMPRNDKIPEGIIARREIGPLLIKANGVLRIYETALDCIASILDQTGHSIEVSESHDILFFCRLCRKYAGPGKSWKENEYPCTQRHIDGINKALHKGGSYIYMCDLGFSYWISPFFANGRFAGSFIAGRVLGIERQRAVKKIHALSGEEISTTEARAYLKNISEKSPEDVKAMAQMLLVCADQMEKSSGDYAEILKKQFDQHANLANQIKLIKIRHTATPPDSGYSLDKERMLLAALRRGDHEMEKKILEELMQGIFRSKPGNFAFMRLRVIELAVLLSRAALGPGNSKDTAAALEENDQYFRRIREAETAEELKKTLNTIVKRMAVRIFSFQGMRHASVLRKAERFIWENFTRKISLREIADASGLSAPYFSTIFKEEMGENLSSYLNRLRVEKAVTLLMETEAPLSEIAGACGFDDQSWFSKIFKNHTGLTPGKYRERGGIIPEGEGQAGSTGEEHG